MRIITPGLVTLLLVSTLYAATDDDVVRTTAYLAALSQRDSARIEAIAQEIQEQWRDEGPTQFAVVMMELCSAVSRMTLPKHRQRQVAQRYAVLALSRATAAVPHDLEIELLRFVTADLYSASPGKQPTQDERVSQRRDKMLLYIRAWQRLEEATIPNFNFDDLPAMSADLPPGVSGFSGMDPAGIRDPEQRKAYIKAAEENHRKAETYLTQHTIRQLKPEFARRLTNFIAAAYTQKPHASQELETLLQLIKDTNLRSTIQNIVGNSYPQ